MFRCINVKSSFGLTGRLKLLFLFLYAIYYGFAVIGGEEGLDLGFGIEGLATEDDVWEETLLAVFLQGAATEFEMLGEFLVGEVSLTVKGWTIGLDEGGKPGCGFLQGLHG